MANLPPQPIGPLCAEAHEPIRVVPELTLRPLCHSLAEPVQTFVGIALSLASSNTASIPFRSVRFTSTVSHHFAPAKMSGSHSLRWSSAPRQLPPGRSHHPRRERGTVDW